MMKPVSNIPWEKMEEAIPAFLAMFLIPLTYSITQGIIWGFLTFTILKLINGKAREIHPMLWIIDILSILLLYLELS